MFDPVDQNNEDNDFSRKGKIIFFKKGEGANFIKENNLERGKG